MRPMKQRRIIRLKAVLGAACGITLLALGVFAPSWAYFSSQQRLASLKTDSVDRPGNDTRTNDRLRRRLADRFHRLGLSFPPRQAVLTSISGERSVDLFATGFDGDYRYVHSYADIVGPRQSGFYLSAGNGTFVNGIRGVAARAKPALDNPELRELTNLLADDALKLIVVDADPRLPMDSVPASGTIARELRASLARLPIPPRRWKAALAAR